MQNLQKFEILPVKQKIYFLSFNIKQRYILSWQSMAQFDWYATSPQRHTRADNALMQLRCHALSLLLFAHRFTQIKKIIFLGIFIKIIGSWKAKVDNTTTKIQVSIWAGSALKNSTRLDSIYVKILIHFTWHRPEKIVFSI